jgi:hypothetical protein
MSHFKKYWAKDTHKAVLNTIQKKVCHLSICNQGLAAPANPSRVAKKKSHVDKLVRRHLETDSEAEDDDEVSEDPNKPWKAEFDRYMDTHDIVPDGMSIVHWWGVCSSCDLNYETGI